MPYRVMIMGWLIAWRMAFSDMMWSTCFRRMISDCTAQRARAQLAASNGSLTLLAAERERPANGAKTNANNEGWRTFFRIFRAVYLPLALCRAMRTRLKVPVPRVSETQREDLAQQPDCVKLPRFPAP